MSDLLDLLDDITHDPATALTHAMRPNMWAACGWCSCGCQGRRSGRYVLTVHATRGVTCTECLRVMREDPWPT